MEIRDFDPRDIGVAADYAIEGMHLDQYASGLALRVYGRYFVAEELQRATQAIAAYEKGRLQGLLLAAMEGEPTRWRSFWQGLFVGAVDPLARGGEGGYLDACHEMRDAYAHDHRLDGELSFFAVNPKAAGQGIGSRLLAELEQREAGKRIFLYTDANCTWQFYEKRGFTRVGKRTVQAGAGNHASELECYLYAKEF